MNTHLNKSHSRYSLVWQFTKIFIGIFVGLNFLPVLLLRDNGENVIIGIPTELYYESITKEIDAQQITGQWKIENPYYFNDICIADWRQAQLTLQKDGTFILKHLPKYLLNQIMEPVIPNGTFHSCSSPIRGCWEIKQGQLNLYWLNEDKDLKDLIFPSGFDILSKKTNHGDLRLQYNLQANSIGGIIWCPCPAVPLSNDNSCASPRALKLPNTGTRIENMSQR